MEVTEEKIEDAEDPCGDTGWLHMYNAEEEKNEIQRCDWCNRFAGDDDAVTAHTEKDCPECVSRIAFEQTKPKGQGGVPVQFKPNEPEQVVKWYCYDCRTVHGIEGCQS